MRIGATSYVYPADIQHNVRRIGAEIHEAQDIELIMFEAEESGYPLPSEVLRAELRSLAVAYGLTYTVHLPLDLRIATPGNHDSVAKALRVVESTKGLNPWGYVIHVEGGIDPTPHTCAMRLTAACRALETIGGALGAMEMLCVENTDVKDHGLLDAVTARIPVSRCVDVGHLWKAGLDPLPFLRSWLPRTRIVHLHGVGERDHLALSLIPSERLAPVVSALERGFAGVITMEVFSEKDFRDSIEAYANAGRPTPVVPLHGTAH